jgi:hypothetical protein
MVPESYEFNTRGNEGRSKPEEGERERDETIGCEQSALEVLTYGEKVRSLVDGLGGRSLELVPEGHGRGVYRARWM